MEYVNYETNSTLPDNLKLIIKDGKFFIEIIEPMEYKYPLIDRTQGYAWNAMERIEQEVGLRPTAMGDSGGSTFVSFSRELTTQEKTILDNLMASNPTLPPTAGGTKFIIRDIWTQKTLIQDQMGFPYKVFYSQSNPGSGVVDQVEIHFDQTLTTQQRNKILTEYAKLITLK
jgi:hypothetical protein